MSSLLNFYDDALKAADDVTDAARKYSRKAKALDGQISMFDEAPSLDLAGFSRNKPVYQSGLAGLYDTLAPNTAPSKNYMEYLDGLSDTQVQDLLPRSSLDVVNDQMGQMSLQDIQSLYADPDTRSIAEILNKHIK